MVKISKFIDKNFKIYKNNKIILINYKIGTMILQKVDI